MRIVRISSIFVISIFMISAISVASSGTSFLIDNAFATIGEITGTIENLQINAANDDLVYVMPLSGDIYVIGYGKNGDTGPRVSTVTVTSTGDIGAIIDTVDMDTNGEVISWQKVDSDTFAVFYRGPSEYGTIKTVQIAADGDISACCQDTKVWEWNAVNRVSTTSIDADTFAIAFTGNGGALGNVTTADIAADGSITVGSSFFLFSDGKNTAGTSIAEVVPNFVGILWQAGVSGTDMDFVTVAISDTGVVTNAAADRLVAVSDSAAFPSGPPFMIDSNTAVLPYQETGTGVAIKTVDITAGTGAISAVIDTQVIDANGEQSPHMFTVSGNVYGMVYEGGGDDMYASTIEISSSGNIVDTVISTVELRDAVTCFSASTPYELSTGNYLFGYACSTDMTTFSIVTVTATSSSSGGSDNSAPSIGSAGANGINSIDSGFAYNQKPTDVTGWKTDYPLVRTPTGQLNTLDLKVKENKGLTNIYFVSVHFGVPKAGDRGEAIVTYYPNQKNPIKIDDPNNLLGEVDFKVNPVKCKANSTTESCFNFSLDHSFNDVPIHEMVGITMADLSRNVAYAYFNHGVEVYGDSLNPPVTQIITNPYEKYTPQITLTQTNRELDIWIDENENEWTRNIMGSWLKITQDEYTLPDDDIMGENGYKRIHDHFATYVKGQEVIATQIWDSSEIQSDIPNVIKSRTFNENESLIQNEIQKEIEKAQTVWDAELIQKTIQDSTETTLFKKISRMNNIGLQQNIKYEIENAETFMIKFQLDESVNLIDESTNVQQNFAKNYIPHGKIIEDSAYTDDIRWAEFEKAKQMLNEQYDPTRFFKYN